MRCHLWARPQALSHQRVPGPEPARPPRRRPEQWAVVCL